MHDTNENSPEQEDQTRPSLSELSDQELQEMIDRRMAYLKENDPMRYLQCLEYRAETHLLNTIKKL